MFRWLPSALLLLLLSSPLRAADPDPSADAARLKALADSRAAEIRLLEEQVRQLMQLVRVLKNQPPPEVSAITSALGLISGSLSIRPPVQGSILGISASGLVLVQPGRKAGLQPGDILEVLHSDKVSGEPTPHGKIRLIRVDPETSVGEYQSGGRERLPAVSDPVRRLR